MTPPTSPPDDDPVIDEIRAVRTRIWDECGRDPQRLLDRLREVQERHRDRLLPLPPGESADQAA